MKHPEDADRAWARFLLFAMTVVCVIGAWRTPQQLNIPADSTVYAYREINREGWHPRPPR